MRIKKIFKIFWLAAIPIVVIYSVYGFYRLLHNTNYDPQISTTAPPQYAGLFNSDAKEKMMLKLNYSSKERNPFSDFIYDNRYSVLIYEMSAKRLSALPKLINEDSGSVSRGGNIVYNGIKIHNYYLYYASEPAPIVNNLFLTFEGDSLKKTTINDSTLYYDLILGNFSIKYTKKDIPDIVIEKINPFSNKVPVKLIFTIKNGRLFFIIISNISQNDPVEKDLPAEVLKIKGL